MASYDMVSVIRSMELSTTTSSSHRESDDIGLSMKQDEWMKGLVCIEGQHYHTRSPGTAAHDSGIVSSVPRQVNRSGTTHDSYFMKSF